MTESESGTIVQFREVNWEIIDASVLAAENPYSFYRPSETMVGKLRVGDRAKLIFQMKKWPEGEPHGERMWVKIEEVDSGGFVGSLVNHPFLIPQPDIGERIEFEGRHVIETSLEDTEPSAVDRWLLRCRVSLSILSGDEAINSFVRENPVNEIDSGWRFCSSFNGTMSDRFEEVALCVVLRIDDQHVEYLDDEVGATYRRSWGGKYIAL